MCNVKMISAQCGFCLRLYTLSIWDKMFSSHLCRHVQPICCGVSDILCVQPTLQYHSVQNPKMIHLKKPLLLSSHSTVADLIKICTTALFRRPKNFKGGYQPQIWLFSLGTSINDVPHFLAIFDLPTYLVLLYNIGFWGLSWTPPLTYPNMIVIIGLHNFHQN